MKNHPRRSLSVMGRSLCSAVLLSLPLMASASLVISSPAPSDWATDNTPIVESMPRTSADRLFDINSARLDPLIGHSQQPSFLQSYDNLSRDHVATVLAAEAMAAPPAQRVLRQARKMALEERAIIQGGCWDYLNSVFKKVGVGRDTVFKGSYESGPFAKSEQIRSGDWLYFINHSYNDIEHSGLFIGWLDKSSRQALILSYAGEHRREPARYKAYDLSHVYQIMRPVD